MHLFSFTRDFAKCEEDHFNSITKLLH